MDGQTVTLLLTADDDDDDGGGGGGGTLGAVGAGNTRRLDVLSEAPIYNTNTAHASDGQNQIAIRFNRDLNSVDDSIQTLRDSIQVVCDSIGYCIDSEFSATCTRFGQKIATDFMKQELCISF